MKPDISPLGLMDKQIERSYGILFLYDNSDEPSLWTKIERLTNTHTGRKDGEERAKLTVLIKEKTSINFISTGKTLLDFLEKLKEMKMWF